MAEGANGINFMAMLNPQFAAQQQKFALQQAMAQQMMQQGSEEPPTNQLANPGGMVIKNSPLGAASRGIEKALGAYMMNKNIDNQMNAYAGMSGQQTQDQSPTGQGGAPLLPWQTNASTGQPQSQQIGNVMAGGGNMPSMQDIIKEQVAPVWAKGQMDQQRELALKGLQMVNGQVVPISGYNPAVAGTAGAVKGAETGNTPYQTPQGTYVMGNQIMGGGKTSIPVPQPVSTPVTAMPTAPVTSISAHPAQPVSITRDNQSQVAAPLASDGKPLLPNIKNIPAPDPSGTPAFKTENTKTGVEQTIQDQKDAAEGNKAFSATAQSLGQEKARLDNLIQVYKDVQSGTLTAQNPEFFNKMAALGFKDDPQSIKDLAGIQNATQNHILQVIQQIKDTNANAGGGAPTRVFGSEISQLLENGESTKGQPEALWNVIGQAKGVVDHHLDMVNGWQKSGGLGNRLAGGYTMRPDDFATQFSTSHNISDYRDKALKDMGPFKGMPGNTAPTPSANPNTKTIGGVNYTKINGVWHQ